MTHVYLDYKLTFNSFILLYYDLEDYINLKLSNKDTLFTILNLIVSTDVVAIHGKQKEEQCKQEHSQSSNKRQGNALARDNFL